MKNKRFNGRICDSRASATLVRRNKRVFTASYGVIAGSFFSYYDADNGSCLGNDPDPLYLIKDIDVKALFAALKIKGEEGLKQALDRLPGEGNDIIRLKDFCDENHISYKLSRGNYGF
ncbi:hypothetical protein [Parabacteroides sp.]